MSRIIIFFILFLLTRQISAQENDYDIAILGDSQTWLSGDDCTKEKGWATWFKEDFNPKSICSYARSGATWTCVPNTKRNIVENVGILSDNNVIYNQLERLDDAIKNGNQVLPNLIIIAAGINDLWFKNKRPHFFEDSDSLLVLQNANQLLSFRAAFRYSVQTIKTRYPNCKILIITPLQSIKVDNNLLEKACDLMEDLANNQKIMLIRLDKLSPIRSKQEIITKTYTYDGTHTNVLGAKQNGKIVSENLKQLLSN